MAKADSLITVVGTVGGLTFVKSVKYGNHVRAARGTHKEAKLNAAFQAQSKKLVKSNVPAKIIKDAIHPYRKDFYYGQLWQNLISLINKQFPKGTTFDFSELKPFDINPDYPLDHLVTFNTTTAVDRKSLKLQVNLSYNMPPVFPKSLPLVDGFRVGVIAIFPNPKKENAKTEAVYSNIIPLTENVAPLQMEFSIPKSAKTFLVCVRLDGCERGKLAETFPAKGMKMVEAGKV